MDNKRSYFYDVETYRNLFSITAKELRRDRDGSVLQFIIDESRNDYDLIHQWIKDITLIGFYNHGFDDPVLNFVLQERANVTDIFEYASSLIFMDSSCDEKVKINRELTTSSLDLSNIKPSGKKRISLKQLAINLKYPKVQDLPYHPESSLTAAQKREVLDYNLNDVLITEALFWKLKSQIDLRLNISELFDIDVTNETESGIADAILEKRFRDRTGNDTFRTGGTEHDSFMLRDCIAKFVTFKSSTMNKFLEDLKTIELRKENGFRYELGLTFANVRYAFGIGGIHSEDQPGIFLSSETLDIIDADVTSYYPNICLKHDIKPEHIGDVFLQEYQGIVDERTEAKGLWKKTKLTKWDTKQSVLKITANAIGGRMGTDYHWLRDKKAFVSMTISGQLSLLMLIEMLNDAGIEVISANTDGIVAKVPKRDRTKYDDICKQWEEITRFALEFTQYKKYVRRDVNSYMTIKHDGEIKEKGCFVRDISLNKGYQHPIVPIALHRYYVDGIEIEDTIRNWDNVYDFCISQQTGHEFEIHAIKPDGTSSEKLQKNNRYIVTNSGCILAKKKPGKIIRLVSDSLCQIVNEIIEVDARKYDLNYQWYIQKAKEITDAIEPRVRQLTFF